MPTWQAVFPLGAETMQDRVVLDVDVVTAEHIVSVAKQEELDATIAGWQHCLGEALKANAQGDPRGVNATRFYEIVADEDKFYV